MQTDRKFAYFAKNFPSFCMDTIPEDGLCISAFLVLWKGKASNVLLGKANPSYEGWPEIGAMDKERVKRNEGRWILPASRLVLFEKPQEAANRIVREQLGVGPISFHEPRAFSEVYEIQRLGWKKHWDVDFIFAEQYESSVRPNAAWSELRFVDVSTIQEVEFGRGHQDILSAAGIG